LFRQQVRIMTMNAQAQPDRLRRKFDSIGAFIIGRFVEIGGQDC
jgi:hypothetical protein